MIGNKSSLLGKMLFSISGLILVFGAIATIATFYLTQNLLISEELKHLPINIVAQSHEVLQILSISRKTVQTVGSNPRILDYLIHRTGDASFLQDFNVGNMFSAIYLLDNKGVAIVSTDPRFLGQNYSFRDYFKYSISGQDHLDIAYGVTSNEVGYYFSTPIKNETGVLGVLVFKLRPQIIEEALSPHGGGGLEYSLVDEFGVITYSTDKSKIFNSLGPLPLESLEKLRATKRYGKDNFVAMDYGTILGSLKSVGSVPVITEIEDKIDRMKEELGIVQIGDFPLYLFAEVSTQTIIDSAFRSSVLIGILVFSAAISAGFLISLLIRQFLGPINELTQFVNQVESGNFDRNLDINTGDEIEELGLAMTKMAQKLKQEKVIIESKVEERTKQLEEINKFMVGRELKMVELKKRIEELEAKK